MTRRLLLIPALGLLLALLSSLVPGHASATYSEIMGCEAACRVAAAGWPWPYLVDHPGISVAGAADITGALVGEDKFRLLPFTLTALFWMTVAAPLLLLWRRMRRQ